MGAFSDIKRGDQLKLTKPHGCYAPEGEELTVVSVSEDGNSMLVSNVSGELNRFEGEYGKSFFE